MIVILGGGLAGLSTAYHLGDEPHVVLEAAPADVLEQRLQVANARHAESADQRQQPDTPPDVA